jgi:uncharacterized OsmC-like protein
MSARATWDADDTSRSALAVRVDAKTSSPIATKVVSEPAQAPVAAGGATPRANVPWVQVLDCDMGPEFGSGHQGPSPAWLCRASVAACAASCIVVQAARAGLAIERVVCEVDSRSDLRGLLGMTDENAEPVSAGPLDLHLRVQVCARGATQAEVLSLIDAALRCSPVQRTVEDATACALQVEVMDA